MEGGQQGRVQPLVRQAVEPQMQPLQAGYLAEAGWQGAEAVVSDVYSMSACCHLHHTWLLELTLKFRPFMFASRSFGFQ